VADRRVSAVAVYLEPLAHPLLDAEGTFMSADLVSSHPSQGGDVGTATTSQELREMAVTIAREGFEARVALMVDAAAGDARALSDAVLSLTSRSTKAGTVEYIAFTYLSAAFNETLSLER
jgi:hypothetical protein